METGIPWNIIAKTLKGQTTPEDQAVLESWLKKDENHFKIYSEIQEVFFLTSFLPPYFYPNKENAWKKIDSRTLHSKVKVWPFFKEFKYAAAVIVFLLMNAMFFLIYISKTQEEHKLFSEIIAPPGQKTMIMLPDSSKVWLNSGSSLKYNGNFNVKDREVLLKGEAFFDVKSNSTKKFRVQTGILSVQVYGTAFNVKNYDNNTYQEITVSEGKVGIFDKSKELKQLIPGQQAVLDKTSNKLVVVTANPEVISSWKNNELKFNNTPFTEVVEYMERWYGVTINIDPSMIGKNSYTFRIKTESLTEILEKIKLITPIGYEINGTDVKIRYTQ